MMIAMTFPIAELRDKNLSPFPMSSNGKYMICSAAVICRILLAMNAKRIPAMTSIRISLFMFDFILSTSNYCFSIISRLLYHKNYRKTIIFQHLYILLLSDTQKSPDTIICQRILILTLFCFRSQLST